MSCYCYPYNEIDVFNFQNLCLTPECVMLAASILGGLDTEQDPCENLYLYASKYYETSATHKPLMILP